MTASLMAAQDTYCPSYPSSSRDFLEQALEKDRAYISYAQALDSKSQPVLTLPESKNFIDDWIFRKTGADRVETAPLTTDSEFLRRVYLDLTGRIPTFEKTEAFLNNRNANKRVALIDELLASQGYVDQMSHWHLERFQVRVGSPGWISISARNNFYRYIRDFVAQDRPYNRVVQEMLAASGDTDVEQALPLLARMIEDTEPVQDFWDDFTNLATTQFLGFKTECISCHDGRRHLERINLYLTPRTRREFWQLSAFFSRTQVRQIADDNAGFRPRLIFSNTSTGVYHGAINPSRPGARPSRADANEQPYYWFTDQKPSGSWRDDFARMLTADRQFARATVNYLWAYFFGSGIVDPPDGWDLARVNPNDPPPEGWPIQNAHPELLEALTDAFIRSNYSTKSVIKLIVNSNTYQLSSRYPSGKWQNAFARYFARYEARRLSAEQILDSLSTATGTESQMSVQGLPDILRYANQLPHPYASSEWTTESILDSLGRGDWRSRRALNKPSLYGILEFLNQWTVSVRTRASANRWSPQTRLTNWVSEGHSDEDIIRRMFIATLTRPPSADEIRLALSFRQADRALWLSGLQWALVQKSDFLFNY